MDDMNDSVSLDQGFRCWEQLSDLVDMNDSGSWA